METPSPFTPLGSKGVGEGNCMSTPVCIANAVADAIGAKDLVLPLVPAKLAEVVRGAEPAPPARPASHAAEKRGGDRKLRGEGEAVVTAGAQQVWDMLLDPNTLAAVIPGCHGVEKISDTHFRADVTLGIGPVKGRYRAEVKLSDLDPPKAVTLAGDCRRRARFWQRRGPHHASRHRRMAAPSIHYVYEAGIGGKVASIGGRLLDGAAKVIIGQFFAALARKAGGGAQHLKGFRCSRRLRQWFGGPR